MEWIIDKYAEKLKEQKEVWQMLQNVMPGRRNESELYDVCKKDKYGFSVLHHAIQNTNWAENTFVVKKLLDLKIAGTDKHYFKITDVDKQGNTSLHLAAQMETDLAAHLVPYLEQEMAYRKACRLGAQKAWKG